MGHSLFSPSASSRWLKCPGSLALCFNLPQETNAYADEGTMLHDVMLQHIRDGKPLESFDLNDEQLAACKSCADYVNENMKGEKLYEIKVNFGKAIGQTDKDASGTVDIASIDEDTLYVCDYKFGYGYVNPRGNTQGMLYSMGLINLLDNIIGYDVKKVRFAILQPRTGNDVDNGYDEWTVEELKEKANEFKKQCAIGKRAVAEYISNGLTPLVRRALVAGETQCKYCRAATMCPALQKQVMDASKDLAQEFEVVEDKPIANAVEEIQAKAKTAPTDKLARALAMIPVIKVYCDAVEKEVMDRALQGEVIKGFKLIEGKQGNRKWSDEGSAAKMMIASGVKSDDCYTTTIVSPAKAEQLLVKTGIKKAEAKTLIEDLVTRADPKPYLVADTEKGGIPFKSLALEFDDLSKQQL